jgi:hypothetical protein
MSQVPQKGITNSFVSGYGNIRDITCVMIDLKNFPFEFFLTSPCPQIIWVPLPIVILRAMTRTYFALRDAFLFASCHGHTAPLRIAPSSVESPQNSQ